MTDTIPRLTSEDKDLLESALISYASEWMDYRDNAFKPEVRVQAGMTVKHCEQVLAKIRFILGVDRHDKFICYRIGRQGDCVRKGY